MAARGEILAQRDEVAAMQGDPSRFKKPCVAPAQTIPSSLAPPPTRPLADSH